VRAADNYAGVHDGARFLPLSACLRLRWRFSAAGRSAGSGVAAPSATTNAFHSTGAYLLCRAVPSCFFYPPSTARVYSHSPSPRRCYPLPRRDPLFTPCAAHARHCCALPARFAAHHALPLHAACAACPALPRALYSPPSLPAFSASEKESVLLDAPRASGAVPPLTASGRRIGVALQRRRSLPRTKLSCTRCGIGNLARCQRTWGGTRTHADWHVAGWAERDGWRCALAAGISGDAALNIPSPILLPARTVYTLCRCGTRGWDETGAL